MDWKASLLQDWLCPRRIQLRYLTVYPMKRFLRGNSSLVTLLQLCKSFNQALQVHAQMVLNGPCDDIFTLSRLISSFALLGSEDGLIHSRNLFAQIDNPNVFIWNTMMRGYSRSNSPHEALLLYKSMLSKGIESPNNFTYPFVLNSCTRLSSLKPGYQVHCHVIQFGFEFDLYIRNALIHLYSVFGHINDARKVFERSFVRDIVSYNTMINGYTQVKQPCAALWLFREMQDSDIRPDGFTLVALLSACSVLNDPRIGKRIHALVYKYLVYIDSNLLLYSAVIDMYAKCGLMNMAEQVFSTMRIKNTAAWSCMVSGYTRVGEVETARRLFDQMEQRDVVSWTAMISGYSQAGQFSEALELFGQMEYMSIQPDEVTLVAVFSACAGLGALDFGKRVLQKYVENVMLGRNVFLTTALIDMYAKCGSIESALDVFNRIPNDLKTVSLFNSTISGLAQHGLGKTAIAIFREMESMGPRPDGVTFVGILCACSHSGLVDEGEELFESMLNVYGIKPEMEHYGCMVDLLARDGRLDDAYDLIQSMPHEANSVIWRALLGACRIHGNAEMGEIAGQKLLELDPDHGARYVLLSNMLANTNQWEGAGRVRKLMEDRGIQKPPGWSYIEFNGTLHRFLANEKSHPQAKQIELMLKDMIMKLKCGGYVTNTSQVVFDVDEEEKETVVAHHSEKLALAFGLINFSPEETIRIIKNLRICGDCHSSFKLLSKIYGREIMVRDSIRFHHFSNGTCSCMDFW